MPHAPRAPGLDAVVRIVLLPSAFHPSVGGVEELTRRLGLELVGRGHVVEVWTSRRDGDDWPEVDEVDGLPVLPERLPGTAQGRRQRCSLPRAGRRRAPAAAPGGTALPAGPAARAVLQHERRLRDCAQRLTGVPLVVTLQGETVMDDNDIFDHSTFLRAALRAGLRRARAVTACRRFTLEDAERRFGLPPGKGRSSSTASTSTRAPRSPSTCPSTGTCWPWAASWRRRASTCSCGRGRCVAPDVPGRGAGDRRRRSPAAGPARARRGAGGRTGCTSRALEPGCGRDRDGGGGGVRHAVPGRALRHRRAGGLAGRHGGHGEQPRRRPEFVRDGVDGLVADPHDAPALCHAMHRHADE